jgi:hypothetical protein
MSNTPKWGGWAIRAAFLALVVAALTLASVAQSTSTNKKTTKKAVATQAAPATASDTSMGQKIYIDPVTRKPIQPTQEDVQALANAGKKTSGLTTQPKAFVNPRGGIAVKLDDSFMMSAVAGKDANGKVVTGCVEDEAKAAAITKSGKLPVSTTTTKGALDEK